MRRECFVRELLEVMVEQINCHVLRILPSENSTVLWVPLLAQQGSPPCLWLWLSLNTGFFEAISMRKQFPFLAVSLNILAVLIYYSH
jgi:hypothetical protein